jgi:hypothetical protein
MPTLAITRACIGSPTQLKRNVNGHMRGRCAHSHAVLVCERAKHTYAFMWGHWRTIICKTCYRVEQYFYR